MSQRRSLAAWATAVAPLLTLAAIAGCSTLSPRGPDVHQSDWAPATGISGVRLETEHYDLKITATDPLLRQILPTFLEATFAEYRRLLPPPEGQPGKCEVYLFANREQWSAFTRRFVPGRAHVYLYIKAGGYVDPRTAAAVVWDIGRDSTLTLLAHEGFHQYLAKYFPEPVVPWLNEGLATQWEAFDLKAGKPVFTPQRNYHRRNSLRESLSNTQGWIPLPRLLAMNAGEAVVQAGQPTRGYYAQVWSLVLFLREGGFREYTRAFDRLLADAGTERLRTNVRAYAAASPTAADASDGQLIFRHYIAEDLDLIERQYRDFCEKLVR